MVSFGSVYMVSFSFSGIFKMVDLKLGIWTSSETISIIFSLSPVYGHTFWCLYMPYYYYYFFLVENWMFWILYCGYVGNQVSRSSGLVLLFKKFSRPCYPWFLWLWFLFSVFYEPVVWSLYSLSYNALDDFG